MNQSTATDLDPVEVVQAVVTSTALVDLGEGRAFVLVRVESLPKTFSGVCDSGSLGIAISSSIYFAYSKN